MTINVKYLSDEEIEREAQGLLETYFRGLGKTIQIPVPVEEILELHLGLSLDFDDLQDILGVPDVLGALWADKREVFIDQSLEPERHPKMEGRYHFSVGHEIGHWQLHRSYLATTGRQVDLLTNSQSEPTVICRTSQAKQRVEWQADCFSSCFLLPRQSVFDSWEARFGNLIPIIHADIAEQSWARRPRGNGPLPIDAVLRHWQQDTFEPHIYAFDRIAREFAPVFRVSIQAMRIRLENLGLLLVDRPMEQGLFG